MAEPLTAPPSLAAGLDACWRRIGVSGDGSCPLLATHIHCRNCPTYAQAAVTLLDTLSAGQLADPEALDAANAGDAQADRAAGQSCVVFRVGDEWLALPTAVLGEVTAPAPVHSLPQRRHAALVGVAAVRGALLTCVSLVLLFGGTEAGGKPDRGSDKIDNKGDAQRAARFLILGQGRNAIALPVSEVAGVRRVPAAALMPLPATLARASAHYTQALFEHEGHTVGLLDAGLLRHALSRSLS
ncbi:chemotaxis protein CheW [Cupriavidus sp. RAF12]|uniref:chemotaxis protein CheW n=1 Tax=Cupriavidus sp. RAF12 TaxID=3233050 RepID=UPI003F902C4A